MHAEDLAHNIDVILQHQDVRQRHHPGEQNRKEECYGRRHLLRPMFDHRLKFIRVRLSICYLKLKPYLFTHKSFYYMVNLTININIY